MSKNKAFLLSEYCLDQKPAHRNGFVLVWDDCDLRRWCNGNFFKTAFNSKEQKLIANTKNSDVDNTLLDVDGGEDTVDKIFLLSIKEATNKKYGFYSEYYEENYMYLTNHNRLASASEYAAAQGCIVNCQDLSAEGQPSVSWLLRTIGNCRDVLSSVNDDGYVYFFSSQDFVRPAMNLNLKNVIE